MPSFHVVLVEPEIPPNTGNIGRLCLAADAHLHLIEPLGFSIDDRALRRAGLDYWPEVRRSTWSSWPAFVQALPAAARCFYLTTKTSRPYHGASFARGDYLIFGRETKGLPESLLAAQSPDRVLTIPMAASARSLNLATAVAIVLFEAVRQTG